MVTYDRQFRREALARKDLNWSIPDPRLYSEAFTGRARSIPRCSFCLQDDHLTQQCPQNPDQFWMSWPMGRCHGGNRLVGKAHQLPHLLVRPIAPASSAGGSMTAAADLRPAGLRTVADSVGGHTQRLPAPRGTSAHDPHSIQRLQPRGTWPMTRRQ